MANLPAAVSYLAVNAYFCVPPGENGDLSEWLKEHAWKVCIPLKGIEGSNPSVSADTMNAHSSWLRFIGQIKLFFVHPFSEMRCCFLAYYDAMIATGK